MNMYLRHPPLSLLTPSPPPPFKGREWVSASPTDSRRGLDHRAFSLVEMVLAIGIGAFAFVGLLASRLT